MKRFIHLFRYIKLLKRNKKLLLDSRINNNLVGIKFDWIFRLYTVLNLPFDDKENITKYGYYYVDNMVKNHIGELNKFLFELGLLEYVTLDIDNIQQIDEYNIRIVLKFKYLNIKKLTIFLAILSLIIIIGLISFFVLLLSTPSSVYSG